MSKKEACISFILTIIIFILFAVLIFADNSYAEPEIVTAAQIEEEREGDSEPVLTLNLNEVELLAKTVYGEARGCSTLEQSAVIWCILNRVDAGYGSVEDVVTAPYQFTGYDVEHPVTEEFAALAEDVLARWILEKHCIGEVGRTLPSEYKWFLGNGRENIFRDQYSGDYNIWDWDCYNPYLTIQE